MRIPGLVRHMTTDVVVRNAEYGSRDPTPFIPVAILYLAEPVFLPVLAIFAMAVQRALPICPAPTSLPLSCPSPRLQRSTSSNYPRRYSRPISSRSFPECNPSPHFPACTLRSFLLPLASCRYCLASFLWCFHGIFTVQKMQYFLVIYFSALQMSLTLAYFPLPTSKMCSDFRRS